MENYIIQPEDNEAQIISDRLSAGYVLMGRTIQSNDDVVLIFMTQGEVERQRIDRINASINDTLKDIDVSSIRSIREWVVKQPDAPQFLKDYEIKVAGCATDFPIIPYFDNECREAGIKIKIDGHYDIID